MWLRLKKGSLEFIWLNIPGQAGPSTTVSTEYVIGGRPHNISGQLFILLSNLHSKEVFSHAQKEFLVFQTMFIAFCLVPEGH